MKKDLEQAKALKRLSKQDINIDIIQSLINNAQDGVEVIIDMNGAKLVIRKTNNQIGYKSFRDSYNEYRGV